MDAEALGRDRRLIVGECRTSQGVLWLVPDLDGCEHCFCEDKELCKEVQCFPDPNHPGPAESVIALEPTEEALAKYVSLAVTAKLLE